MIQPLVTIAVATFNRLDSLKETLKSIQNQKYSNIEVIVINDNSSDDTKFFLDNYKMLNKKLTVINNISNKGLAHNRNKGIFDGKGQYFTFIDDDDYLTENAIEDYVNYANKIKDKNFIILGGSQVNYSNRLYKKKEIHNIISFDKSLVDALKIGLTPPVGAQFYPREMLVQVQGYNENVKSGVDHDLWIRLIRINPSIYCMKSITTIPNFKYDSVDRMTKKHSDRYVKIEDALKFWELDLQMVSENFFSHFKACYHYYLKKKSMSKIKFGFYLLFKFKHKNKITFIRHFF